MSSALPAADRMARAVVHFIHSQARSVGDEIARVEAAMGALPAIAIAPMGGPENAEDSLMLRRLQGHVQALRDISSLQRPPADDNSSELVTSS